VWTEEAVYLIKLEDKRETDGETEYHMKEIELKLSAGAATIDSLVSAAQDLSARAIAADLATAAGELNFTVQTTPPFAEGLPIPGLGLVPRVWRFAFGHEVGEVSAVISDEQNYYVSSVAARIPEAVTPLEDVRAQISAVLIEEKRREATFRSAEGFFRSLLDTESEFVATADNYGYAIERTDTFSVHTAVADRIPPYSAFAYAALGAVEVNRKMLAPPVESDGIVYVTQLLYRSEMDVAAFEQQAEPIRDRLFQRKVQQYIAWWYDDLIEQGDIEDLRDAL